MNICLYGASSTEIDDSYILATEELGEKIGDKGELIGGIVLIILGIKMLF